MALTTLRSPIFIRAWLWWIVRLAMLLLLVGVAALAVRPTESSRQSGFHLGLEKSGIGGTPFRAIKSFDIMIEDGFPQSVYVRWLAIPGRGAIGVTAWLREPHGVRIPIGVSRHGRMQVNKMVAAGATIEVKGKIAMPAGGLTKQQIMRRMGSTETVRIVYMEAAKRFVQLVGQ